MHPSSDEKRYLFDKPENVKRLMHGLYAVCGLLVVLDFVIHRHILHSWERLPAFYAIYGFVGCVLLVLIAKLMRTFLMRPEDYYLSREQEPKPADPVAGKQAEPH